MPYLEPAMTAFPFVTFHPCNPRNKSRSILLFII
jgi:hypothetical protein